MNSGSPFASLVLILLPLLLILFMVLSARRRQRAMQEFSETLQVGEEVVTTAGLYGVIRELDPARVRLEIADGVVVTIDRRAIGLKAADLPGAAVSRTAPAPSTDKGESTEGPISSEGR